MPGAGDIETVLWPRSSVGWRRWKERSIKGLDSWGGGDGAACSVWEDQGGLHVGGDPQLGL